MSPAISILATSLWILWAILAHLLIRNPRAEPLAGLVFFVVRRYARWFHRLRIQGAENIPPSMHAGPLIVVCNHTAGVDPVLVQAAAPFEITWMMARDMMPAALNPIWEFVGVIPVSRAGADMTAARAALRHLARGGIIGIYPEGGIERPARTVLPFQPGIGLLIRRSAAPVLQVIIDGAPQTPTAWGSLFQRATHAVTLRFLPIRDYTSPDLAHLSATAVANNLRERLIRETGWPSARDRAPETQR